jgi:hypothetical protein
MMSPRDKRSETTSSVGVPNQMIRQSERMTRMAFETCVRHIKLGVVSIATTTAFKF